MTDRGGGLHCVPRISFSPTTVGRNNGVWGHADVHGDTFNLDIRSCPAGLAFNLAQVLAEWRNVTSEA